MTITIKRKIDLLEKLLVKSNDIKVESSSDPIFKSWKNQVERTFIKIYGENSHEFVSFSRLNFFFNPSFSFLGDDHSMQHLNRFRKDLDLTKQNIQCYIDDLKDDLKEQDSGTHIEQDTNNNKQSIKKIFISHSSGDKNYVEEIIDLIETIGLTSNQIFCSSFEGYGIELGQDFLERIKEELDSDVLVLFLLSENFFNSPVCLCEMGATWIKTNEHIPVLIPPFDFSQIKGVIPLTQGFKINEELKINLFKEKIEKLFNIKNPIEMSAWERKRDRILNRINSI